MMELIIILLISLLILISKQTCTIIFTIYDTSHNLKELIGSVHYYEESNLKVIVFGYPSQQIPKDEISLWRHVRFVDIQQEIEYSNEAKIIKDQDILKFYLFEYIFEEEIVDKAIFIQSGFIFNKKLLKIENGIGNGFDIYTKTGGYEEYLKLKLAIFRGLINDNEPKPFNYNNNLKLSRVLNNSKWSCSIKIRSELIFSGLLSNSMAKDTIATNVALLVPVKNENDHIEDCALLKYLIPSIISTIENLEMITLYIGYDVDDPIFNDQKNRDQIIRDLFNIKVKFYELPKTGWLTFIWNFLFVEAYKDGNEYFIQLNDDVKFLKNGWLNTSISMLAKENKGVIGFNDITWQCNLYTQTLVNRNHYKIFKGHFFPLSLRNWYSDDWITSVYRDHGGKCNKDALISNNNVKTRYKPCDARNLKSALTEGIINLK